MSTKISPDLNMTTRGYSPLFNILSSFSEKNAKRVCKIACVILLPTTGIFFIHNLPYFRDAIV